MSLATATTLFLAAPRSDPALWVGAVYLLTWAVLGFAAIGFVCGRGPRRMIWFGAALFGLGYMVLTRGPARPEPDEYVHIIADQFLTAVRPWLPPVVSGFPAKTAAAAAANARVERALDQPVPMSFPVGAPLEDVVQHIRAATRSVEGREIPIYVDPIALMEAEQTLWSPIRIDINGYPLRTTLPLALRQLGLIYYVKDGVLTITTDTEDDAAPKVDYYLLLGHCVLALLAAGLGAWLVPLVAHRRDHANRGR
jgi:hypothetical protein